jgi:hypothetical protein
MQLLIRYNKVFVATITGVTISVPHVKRNANYSIMTINSTAA